MGQILMRLKHEGESLKQCRRLAQLPEAITVFHRKTFEIIHADVSFV